MASGEISKADFRTFLAETLGAVQRRICTAMPFSEVSRTFVNAAGLQAKPFQGDLPLGKRVTADMRPTYRPPELGGRHSGMCGGGLQVGMLLEHVRDRRLDSDIQYPSHRPVRPPSGPLNAAAAPLGGQYVNDTGQRVSTRKPASQSNMIPAWTCRNTYWKPRALRGDPMKRTCPIWYGGIEISGFLFLMARYDTTG
jgi:hypothetical protein